MNLLESSVFCLQMSMMRVQPNRAVYMAPAFPYPDSTPIIWATSAIVPMASLERHAMVSLVVEFGATCAEAVAIVASSSHLLQMWRQRSWLEFR